MKKSLLNYALLGMLVIPGSVIVAQATAVPALAQSQQRITVKGTVTDATGEPLIGASIKVKNTVNGVITDFDGNFSLNDVAVGSTLEISYVGFNTKEMTVKDSAPITVVLEDDNTALEEVVVVGYGVQKKKLVTGATVQVKGDDVARMNTTSALSALQSQTPGVNIVANNGQPGGGFKVNIRGLGTVGDSQPLYVIDGVAGGDINNLNPADIESIDVLKDAASAAIYGSRAANGVILVTTKQGKEGKVTVSFDAYMSVQNMYKKPNTLTAQQYISLIDAQQFSKGAPLYDWSMQLGEKTYNRIKAGWTGSDWLSESLNKNALSQNYALNIAGGSQTSKFSIGFSYTDQEGIIGKPTTPNYKRYTARVNSSHVLLRSNNRDVVTVGESLTFYYNTSNGIAEVQAEYSDMRNLLTVTPLLPMYNEKGGLYTAADKETDGWIYDFNAANPLLVMQKDHGRNLSRNYGLNATAYLEIEPVKNLRYRTSFSYRMTSTTNRSSIIPYRASSNMGSDTYKVNQSASIGHRISAENTLTYKLPSFNGHQFDALVGQSIEKTAVGENLSAGNGVTNGEQLPTLNDNFNSAWLTNTVNVLNGTSISGTPWPDWSLASFFGRVNYNYKDKYMATFIMRTDGSSNFARGHRWGTFPSVSAGWVVSNEKFMEKVSSWLNFLKLRASWGRNGNQSISNFQYVSPVAFDKSHVYNFGNTILNSTADKTIGAYTTALANPNVTWETSEQLNVGLDAYFLDSRLALNLDYYIKTTKDWLVQAPVLATAGTGAPYINGGDVENKGFEVSLGWHDNVGEFAYNVNANLSYNHNEVTRIANPEGIIHGSSGVLGNVAGMGEFYRAQVGFPIGYFWGYKTAGVFQNQQQIDAWRAAGNGVIQAVPVPGDLIYVDNNHDGMINDDDRTMIGNPNPDFRFGLNAGAQWKGFDLGITLQGAFGHQLVYAYRGSTTDALDYWHGEGTSNRYPRLNAAGVSGGMDDTYIENGDYLKIQNATLGYDFKHLFPKMPLGKLRLYASVQNLYTFTGYKGLDPEVGYGNVSWCSGIDLGSYPSARSVLFGLNVQF